MARKKTVVDAELQALYDRVPDIGCKGLCSYTCTSIDASARERQRIREAGVVLPEAGLMARLNASVDGYRCPALVDDRCSVYEVRPMICRLGGVSEALPCAHGCEPDGGLMSAVELVELLARAHTAGGHPRWDAARLEEVLAQLEDPGTREQLRSAAMAHVEAVGSGDGPWARVVITGGGTV